MTLTATFRLISLIGLVLLLALALSCGGETDANGESQGGFAERTGDDGATSRDSDEDEDSSVSRSSGDSSSTGQSPSRSGDGPSTSADAAPEPVDPRKPPGYLLGTDYGLALAQTTRRPSETRDGWVDITLNLVATRLDGGGLAVPQGEQESLCLGPSDCISVQWGSEEQNQAILRTRGEAAVEQWPGIDAHWEIGALTGRKALNLEVTFEVAANADRSSLLFGDHKISLGLEGDEWTTPAQAVRPSAPVPPPSQDPKTANFFMDRNHGIAVTNVYRVVAPNDLMSLARVELLVLPLDGYDGSLPHIPSLGLSVVTGNVCIGNGFTELGKDPWSPPRTTQELPEGECLEIWWGEEAQFNAVLSGYHSDWPGSDPGTFFPRQDTRPLGARWPVPVTLEFLLPRNYHTALLKFGEHELPLDLRGMSGSDPAYDYTAHYDEASPGSVLYDREGKTVVLDRIEHDPDTGDMKLTLTASNSSEASDFTPVFNQMAEFSAHGLIEVSKGNRIVTCQTLPPGGASPLRLVVPRAVNDGNHPRSYVPYSPDSQKRPDGVLVAVLDASEAFEQDATGGGSRAAPPAPAPRGVQPSAPDCQATGHSSDHRAWQPLFVRFDRSGDEETFWPLKLSWRKALPDSDSKPPATLLAFGDGVTYLIDHSFVFDLTRDYWRGFSVVEAVDVETGSTLWQVGFRGYRGVLSDGKLYVASVDEGVIAINAANGFPLWSSDGELVTVEGGVVYELAGGDQSLLSARDGVTGDTLWRSERYPDWHRYYPSRNHAFQDGMFYGVEPTHNVGTLFALDATTGNLLWSDLLRHAPHGWAPILAIDGKVYVGFPNRHNRGSRLVAYDGATGSIVWDSGVLRRTDGVSVVASEEDEVVYLAAYEGWGSDELYAFGADTGELVWECIGSDAQACPISPIVSANDLLFATEWDGGGIVALDAASGETRWKLDRGTPLSVDDEVLYVEEGSNILGVDVPTGNLLWEIPLPESQGDSAISTVTPLLIGDEVVLVQSFGHLLAIVVNKGSDGNTSKKALSPPEANLPG